MKCLERLARALRRYDESHNFTCDVCGREVFGGERVCAHCMRSLPFITTRCPLCGRSVGEAGVCLDCKAAAPATDLARSRFRHEGEAARLVVRYKRGQKYLFRTLADLTEPLLAEFPAADLLTFVPMTARAERERGYNQSRLLAEELARRRGIPCAPLAEKTRETEAQKTLGRRERAENLKGCFRVCDRKAVKGKHILIVDDTYTTGATVGELALACKRAGADSVYALTVTSVAKRERP